MNRPLLRPLTALSLAVSLLPQRAEAVRIWEEPRPGWTPPPGTLVPGGLSLGSALGGPGAAPDLRPPPTQSWLTPLAAGGHAGQSRYPEDVSWRWFDINFYTQALFTYQTGFDPDAAVNFSAPPGLTLRRTRVVLHGQAHPMLQVRMEVNIGDRVDLLDAYVLVPVRRWLQVQAGQFRVPFSRQELVSGARFQFTEPSLWSGNANASGVRFIPSFTPGVMVWGWAGPRDLVEYYAGVFDSRDVNNPNVLDGFFMYAGRVVVNPLGRPRIFQESALGLPRAPTLAIALDAAAQTRQVITAGATPTSLRERSITLGADLFASGWGASLYAEVYARDTELSDNTTVPNTQSLGWLVQAGYLIPVDFLRDHLEVVARVQGFDPSTCVTRTQGSGCDVRLAPAQTRDAYRDFMSSTAWSVGVNWYQMGHGFKLQADYTFNVERGSVAGRPGVASVDNDVFTLLLAGGF